MLWGINNTTGDAFSRVLYAADLQLELTNGNWTFASIGWDSGGNEMEGTARCGSSSIVLAGGEVDLELDISTATCSDANFLGVTVSETVDDIFSCGDLSYVSGYGVGTPCAHSFDESSEKGHANGFQVILPEFDYEGGSFSYNDGLTSVCYAVESAATQGLAATSVTAVNNLKIPWGTGSLPFPTIVRSFYGPNATSSAGVQASNCQAADDRGYSDFLTEGGLGTLDSYIEGYASGSNLEVYIEVDGSDICSGPGLTTGSGTNLFAAGNGSLGSPYIICTEDQMNAPMTSGDWSSGETYNGAHFELMNDLDFELITNAFTPWGEPIGTTQANHLLGSFVGNDYTIEGIKISVGGVGVGYDDIGGLFRAIGDDVPVKDFTLEDLSLECYETSGSGCGSIGGVVGKMDSSSAVESYISNVTVNGVVEGYANIGGIVGMINDAYIEYAQFRGLVTGYSSLGGIVGIVQASSAGPNSYVDSSYFDGKIITDGGARVGGIVGEINAANPFKVSQSKSRGFLSALDYIGGIVSYGQGTIIEDSYSETSIFSSVTTGNAYTGGLMGWCNTANCPITRSFHTGGPIRVDPGVNANSAGAVFGINGMADDCATSFGTAEIIGTTANTNCTSDTLATAYQANQYNGSNTITTWGGAMASTWFHDDPGEDYPILSWESTRDCSGFMAGGSSGVGSGSENDPIWICSPGHFINMSGGNYYVLKRDLDFEGTVGSINSGASFFNSFDAKFDGEGHIIFNLDMNPAVTNAERGLAYNILSTSHILNTQFYGIDIGDAGLTANTATVTIAPLAVTNNGTIDNISVLNSTVDIATTSYTNTNAGTLKVGGVAGDNYGTISDSFFSLAINVLADYTNQTSKAAIIGGVAAWNQSTGIITELSIANAIAAGDGTATYNTFSGFDIGGVAGVNQGDINKSKVEGAIAINNSGAADVVTGGVASSNLSTISDIRSELVFQITNALSISQYLGGIAGDNTGGTIRRSFYTPISAANNLGGSNQTNFDPISINGTKIDTFCGYSVSGGSVSDLLTGSGVTGCFDDDDTDTYNSFTDSSTFTVDDSNEAAFNSSEDWDIVDDPDELDYTWVYFSDSFPELQITDGDLTDIRWW